MHARPPRRAATLVALAVLALPAPALAGDLWLNANVSEIIVVPDVAHGGVYLAAAVTVPIDLTDFLLIPGAGFEFAPEFGRGGAIAMVTAEKSLTPRLAADLILTLIHDQPGLSWDEATFAAGLGAGVSITA